MDIKQKSLLALTIAALGFLAYQVFQLVDRDITETPVMAQQEYNATLPHSPASPATAPAPVIATVANAPAAQSAMATVATPAAAEPITPQQHAYLQALDSYEIARVHHQLLDEEAAIAAAQQKIAMMHDQTAKIVSTSGVSADNALLGQPVADSFMLSYIDKQNGQWSATVHVGSDYESIGVGSQLPGGYQVVGIDHQGVILQKDQQRERLTFNGIQKLSAPSLMSQSASLPSQSPSAQPVKNTSSLPSHEHLQAALAPAVVPDARSTTPAQASMHTALPAVRSAKAMPVAIHKPVTHGLPYQISIHDAHADEAEDDLDNARLSMDLHLRSVEIMPVMNQPYNTSAYLPQVAPVPQTYHLDGDASTDVAQQYSTESQDDQAASIHHVGLVQHRVLKLPSTKYTIQLLGSADSTIVNTFIQKNKLKHVALKVPVGDVDHPWFIVLYGTYPSFNVAEEKLAKLSSGMREDGAWIRRIGDVQKLVRRALS